MKTTLQELINYMESDNDPPFELQIAIRRAKALLHKERRQIETAYNDGWADCHSRKISGSYFNTNFKEV